MMLDALKTVAPEVYDSVRWVVLLDSAEEQGAEDFGALYLARLDAERTLGCLIFEGGLMVGDRALVVVARKGMAVFRVEVFGRASHAGAGHRQGASALTQMADIIRRVEGWTDYDHELTTISFPAESQVKAFLLATNGPQSLVRELCIHGSFPSQKRTP